MEADHPRRRPLLFLFGGPAGRPGGVVDIGNELGIPVKIVDMCNSDRDDLLDQLRFDELVQEIEAGKYSGGMLAPPCETMSVARAEEGEPGPRRLRAADGPELYGLENLNEQEAQQVKEANLLSTRSLKRAPFM